MRVAMCLLLLFTAGCPGTNHPKPPPGLDIALDQPGNLPEDWNWVVNEKIETITASKILQIKDHSTNSVIDLPLECPSAENELVALLNALYRQQPPQASKFYQVSDMPFGVVTFASHFKAFDASLGIEVPRGKVKTTFVAGQGQVRLAIVSAYKTVKTTEALKDCLRSSLKGRGKTGAFSIVDEFMVGGLIVLEFDATSTNADIDTEVSTVVALKAKVDLNSVKASLIQYGRSSGLSVQALLGALRPSAGGSSDPLQALEIFRRHTNEFNTIGTKPGKLEVQ